MITEKNNVFYCDCGFYFQGSNSGAHDCADGLRNKLAESEARCAALAAEIAGLKAFKTAVYQQMGAGCEAPEFSITEGLSNLRRFADTLHTIERDFFTKEIPDEECEGETIEECPLGWGMSVEQYVSEFRKCMAEVRAQGVDSAINTVIVMMNHQHPVTSKAIDILRAHAYQLRKGVQS